MTEKKTPEDPDRPDFVKWFSELSNKDVAIAGGKGASLAEMYNIKMPIPPGFVVTAQAYQYFIEKTKIKEKIHEILSKLDINNTAELNKASKEIREIIESQALPGEMQEEIAEAYEILDVKKDRKDDQALDVLQKSENLFVAVRSSATTEDLADASFAGQQETFLNVKGNEQLIEKVRKCMSSLFTPRAIFYREKKGFKHEEALVAVVVQKMIDSAKSGVIFSENPTKTDKNIVIEAVFGLGEGIVSGKIKPDHYEISLNLGDFKITEQEISKKKIAIIRNKQGKNETIKLDKEQAEKQVLNNYEIKILSQHAKKLEEHYKKPQDIEFAIDETGIYIVQSRPITTSAKESEEEIEGEILLSGLAASPGISSGTVKIIRSLEELEKIQEKDVLVTEMTNPDMVVAMQKSVAIVTDEGGVTSHAAIVSREMGIPAVVGTGDATSKLKEGDVITVDGNTGKIYAGKGQTKLTQILPVVKTKTEIKVIVDLPEAAERASLSKAKAIGLMRLEGIIATGGKHPLKFVQDKKIEDYIKLLSSGIKKISQYFEEIWIRTSDIRSDEFRNLEGASKEVEGNPMLGDHGVRFSLKHPEIMKAELQAVKEVADDFPNKKFGIMMPQVISVKEVQDTKKLSEEVSLPDNIEIGIMVETPASVQIIKDLCEEGIAFISFGTNDLTQYTLAIDRNNEEVQNIFDEMHPAVLNSISHVIRNCKQHNVKTSICGQAGSRKDMVKFLIRKGIDSISVNADAAQKISKLVAELESMEEIPEIPEETSQAIEPIEEQQETELSLLEEQPSGLETEETPQVPGPLTKPIKFQEHLQGKDMEEVILKQLEDEKEENNDYMPGPTNGDEDVPPLNEAIPVNSDSFKDMSNEEAEREAEIELAEELIEELADSPITPEEPEELGEEWKGEKHRKHHTHDIYS